MNNSRGMALFIVLGIFFIVVLLANITLGIISSQSRLTRHNISRIQAYYAALAGVNYAYEMMRTGAWPVPSGASPDYYSICRTGSSCNYTDPDLPASISDGKVYITIYRSGAANCAPPAGTAACISASVDYTYTAP